MYLSPQKFKRLLNIYPPYIGAGVRVAAISEDWKTVEMEMKLRWYNRNAVGSHFGGSLYSMVDPQLMLMLMQLLGKEYFVWDKSAAIEYVKPSRARVSATIEVTDAQLESIHEATASGEKFLPEFEVLVKDLDGSTVAIVKKVIYIRRKPKHRIPAESD